MSRFLISVIIPTRNRQQYAEAATRQILGLNQDIQVILQDNSDDDSLSSNISDLMNDSHFVYHHVNERLSFVDNYEMATTYAEGEYFIAIGDDDGLLSNITECVKWMKECKIDALKPSVKSTYFWPDINSEVEAKREGVFSTIPFSGKIRFYDTQKAVIELLKHGGQEYLKFPLSGTYHRIIRMDLMYRVKEITGRFYGGLTPDMYSTACLSLLPGLRFAEIDYPISLPGVCPSSASAKSSKGEHSGRLESAPHFIGLKEPYIWDERIPHYYSVETIWAETLLKAIEGMGQGKLIDDYFKDDYLLYFLYKNNQNVKQEIEIVVGSERINAVNVDITKQRNKLSKLYDRSKMYILRRIPGNSVVYSVCKNIEEATSEMNKMISSKLMRKKWGKLVSSSKIIAKINE